MKLSDLFKKKEKQEVEKKMSMNEFMFGMLICSIKAGMTERDIIQHIGKEPDYQEQFDIWTAIAYNDPGGKGSFVLILKNRVMFYMDRQNNMFANKAAVKDSFRKLNDQLSRSNKG